MDIQFITVSELRGHATAYVARVEKGEQFIITKRGKPVATLQSIIKSKASLIAKGLLTLEKGDKSHGKKK